MQGDAARIILVAGSLAVAVAAGQDAGPPPVPYERGRYVHWVDHDGDCLDTRQEVLMAESRTPVRLDPTGCRVAEGLWRDPFTDREVTDPSALDVDHLVPLAEAHRSGASAWTPAEGRQYANDLMHPDALVAVTAEANRSKGDGDPAHWLPPGEDQRCTIPSLCGAACPAQVPVCPARLKFGSREGTVGLQLPGFIPVATRSGTHILRRCVPERRSALDVALHASTRKVLPCKRQKHLRPESLASCRSARSSTTSAST